MQDIKIQIRKLRKEDCKVIYNWRNDPVSRSMFMDSNIVAYSDHKNWLSKAINDPYKALYIGEINEEKIGITRFDINKENTTADVSININPLMRSRGLGKILLIKSIEKFDNKNIKTLTARIKYNNIASKKIFEYAGFIEFKREKDIVYLEHPATNLLFKEVDIYDTNLLFELLYQRDHSISHRSMPSYSQHEKFVASHPYVHWYLVYNNEKPIGSFYIKSDNSIGLNIINPNTIIIKEILLYIKKQFSPKPQVPSLVPPYFYFNVAYSNTMLSQILQDIGSLPIQTSYKLI